MRWIPILLGLLLLSSCGRIPSADTSWLYQLQDVEPREIAKTGFDYVVMDYSSDGSEDGEFSRSDVELIRSSGKVVLAYISIGEAEDYRFYWDEDWYEDPPEWLGKENPEWPGNYAVKYWNEDWKGIIREYVERVLDQGFDGVYLDKVDEFEYWADPENGEGTVLSLETSARLMVDFIEEISDWLGGKLLFIQNGENIVEYANERFFEVVDGIGLEDLFFDGLEEVPPEETNYRMEYISEFLERGKTVLSVEYIVDETDPSSLKRIEEYYSKARGLNMIPYAAMRDRELDEIVTVEGIQPGG